MDSRSWCVASLLAIAVVTTATARESSRTAQNTVANPGGVEAAAYDAVVTAYRGGDVPRAVAEYVRLIGPARPEEFTSSTRPLQIWKDGRIERRVPELHVSGAIGVWIDGARVRARQSDIEVMLLVATEALLNAWSETSMQSAVSSAYLAPVDAIHRVLKERDPTSRVLRAWYLLWESFRQRRVRDRYQNQPEYSDDAVDAFPDDALVLLSLGSLRQTQWLASGLNPRLMLTASPGELDGTVRGVLEEGRKYLEKSLAIDAGEAETRLRLAHALIELGDLDKAAATLAARTWQPDEAGFEYLARLFEGEMSQRRGDVAAALASFDRAIALVPQPQAARVARTRLLLSQGQRSVAGLEAMNVLSEERGQLDPWWVFITGQAWRFEQYRAAARATVMTKR